MSFDVTQITPTFITPDDYFNYWGHDLREDFLDTDNPSMHANIFLYRVETRLKSYIDTCTFRNFDWDKLSEYQNKMFCMALLEQAYYMWRNGDIASDSGYDTERGIIANKGDLQSLAISEPAKQYLINGGLWSCKIKPRHRTGGFWKGIF